jgi:two-component system, OmpR family, sensor kinase
MEHMRKADNGGPSGIEQFIDAVAHEVRTPLSIAKMAATTLSTRDLDGEERARLLAMVVRNTELALLLIGRMSLAREVEIDAVRLAPQPVDLGRIVRESVSDLREAVLGDHPVRVDAPATSAVRADPTAVREIMLNLLLNAAKYSPGTAPIEVTLQASDHDVVVVVGDHGDGIDDADMERIFDKYVQVAEGSGGVGLGLYISRGLARAHGGDLTVRPGQPEGTEFVLRLPTAAPIVTGDLGAPVDTDLAGTVS